MGEELGVPALDVKVVPADENRFGAGHGFNTARRTTRRTRSERGGKIRAKAQLLAGAALERRPTACTWENGAFVGRAGGRRADLALYAHGTGALPPGVEGGLDAQTVYRD